MAIRVLLRAYPHRSIALVAQHHALIFRHDSSTTESALINSLSSNYFAKNQIDLDSASAARHVVEFSPCASAELDDYYSLSSLPIHGTLGLITINNDVFLCVVKEASKVASVRPGETVEQISSVEFYCLNKSDYDQHLGENIHPHSADGSYSYNQAERDPLLEHPCVELKKLLGNGSFYYSLDFDLTTRLQNRSAQVDSLDMDSMDQSFLWNSYMISPLVKFRSRLLKHEKEALDRSQILISAIRGFVLTLPIPSISAPLSSKKADAPSNLTLISRLSCRRAGTRFNSRGIDDDGNVANFVESETIYWSPSTSIGGESISAEKLSGICFSYVQTRGSVPVFWEQAAGLIPGQQKITITRSSEGSQPTFEKHFDELEQNYGSVHIVNLLSETKPGEAELTSLYRRAVRKTCLERTGEKCAQRQLLSETEFDFHAETKGPGGYEAASVIRKLIKNSAEEFAYYLSEGLVDSPEDSQEEPCIKTSIVFQQHGVFRTNCLDCLDRTNLIQTIISQMAVEIFLGHRGELAKPEFWVRHSTIWADNGDALSRIYAGTGALKSSFTRHGKMSFAGAIADARKSATRLYINNFADKGRQNTIDLLLGRLVGQKAAYLIDPINEFITAQLSTRRAEYETSDTIEIWCGTFNLNGRINGVNADLSSWLFPGLKTSQNTPDIVTIGFQEIVELSPQQIMNSDPSRRKAWEKAVQTTLNKQCRENGTDRYILLRSGQLVGAALMIFVKKSILANIRNVEGSLKKTGLSGIAGNKGAVAIRMDYANTSICFVTAHFAAGHTNYDERNLNYNTINSGLRFQRNRGIIDHDTVIWMGDFNYRIHLGIERVKHLIDNGDLGALFESDQLNVQMKRGLVFSSYVESKITFMPTYKFNLDEDAYDDSEKARIPAWTDRILRKGDNIRQVNYNTAPLRFSDHRPVYGTFLCTVKIIDEARREAISRQLYDEYRAYVSTRKASTQSDNPLEDLIEYDSLDPGLSSVGSDLVNIQIPVDNSKTAYLRKNASNNGRGSNLDRPSTSSNEESDWVTIPRSNPPHISRSITSPSLRPQDSISAIPKETNNQLNASKPPPMPARTQTSTQNFLSDNQSDAKQETKGIIRSYSTDGHVSSQGSITKNNKALPIVARKPDHWKSPPIVRKPAHLSSSSLTPKTIPRATSSAVLARDSMSHSPTPENRGSYNENKFENFYKKADREAPTPPASRRSGNNKLPMSSGSLASTGNHPRPIRHEETDLLGDDNDARFCEIKALKPK